MSQHKKRKLKSGLLLVLTGLCASQAIANTFAASASSARDVNHVDAIPTVLEPAPVASTLPLTEETLLARKQAVAEATGIEADTQTAIIGLYDKAIVQSQNAAELKAHTEAMSQKRQAIAENLARLRDQRMAPDDVSVANVGTEQAEQALAVAQRTLGEARERVTQLEAESKRRGERLAKIPSESNEAQNQLSAVNAQLQAPPKTGQPAALIEARRILWHCQAQALQSRLEYNQLERQYYPASDELLVAEREWAARQVVDIEKQVTAWQQHLDRLRQQEAAAEQRTAERVAREAQLAHPAIKALAEGNAELTQDEAYLVGKVSETATQAQNLQARAQALREELAHLRSSVEKGHGVTHVMGTFLIGKRANLPLVGLHRRRIRDRLIEISHAQVEWMSADQQWAQLARLERGTSALLTEAMPELSAAQRARLQPEAQPLVQKRRQILERMRKSYLDYSTALAELDAQERDYVNTLEAYADFLDTHILWARNRSPLKPQQLKVAWEGVRWLTDASRWRSLAASVARDARQHPSPYLLWLLMGTALIVMRHWACTRIRKVADGMGTTQVGGLLDTGWVLVLTALASWAWAGCVWLLQLRLAALPEDRDFVDVVRVGLCGWAWLLLLVGTVRAIYLPRGLADIHLRVKTETVLYVRRHLLFLFWLLVPLTFLWRAAIHHADPRYVNSLGALAFIGELLVLSVFTAKTLHIRGPLLSQSLQRKEGSWFFRLRYLWYGGTVGSFLLIALLTALGYLYAARQLFEQVAATLILVLLTLLLYGLIKRWLWVTRCRLAQLEDQRRQDLAREAEATPPETTDPPKEPDRSDDNSRATIFELSTQAQQVINIVVTVILMLALWQIWNDMLPALESLETVRLWQTTDAQGGDLVITLGSLVKAFLIALVTMVTARNVPGLLEMLVLGRLPLDRGLRFAIVTLCRYGLVATGTVLTFNQIGVGWSKVQWLIAAMTVGLGFGLQEIFANFISGLIILFERPIRVDDIVTVGEVTGRVTMIKTRATTIRRMDERELIVPNKEFVTGHLINWTLTDNVLRKEFIVGIAYGSDIGKAERLLYEVAHAHPRVLKEPAPFVVFQGFGSSSLDFELRVYVTGMAQYIQVWHEINCAIDTAFRREGIEIAFPQRDLHLRSIDPRAAQALGRQEPESNH